jgi:hypothetical protein
MLRALSQAVAALLGTGTNDNAAAGHLGEYITSTVASGAAVALATGVAKTVTSISLTAGDWDVRGAVDFTFAATTSYTQIAAGISDANNTLLTQAGTANVGTDPNDVFATPAQVPTALPYSLTTPTVRVSLAATTTIYLIAQATFTVAALSAYGTISARRVR